MQKCRDNMQINFIRKNLDKVKLLFIFPVHKEVESRSNLNNLSDPNLFVVNW